MRTENRRNTTGARLALCCWCWVLGADAASSHLPFFCRLPPVSHTYSMRGDVVCNCGRRSASTTRPLDFVGRLHDVRAGIADAAIAVCWWRRHGVGDDTCRWRRRARPPPTTARWHSTVCTYSVACACARGGPFGSPFDNLRRSPHLLISSPQVNLGAFCR